MNARDYEQLTLYQEDSPVSHFPWLESKKAKGTIVTSGRKCSGLSANLSRVGYLVKTYLESSRLPGSPFVRTWSVRDTLSPYLIMKLRLSERTTEGSECSLLPTATATLATHGGPNQRGSSGRPGLQMAAMMWPTPRAQEHKDVIQSIPPSRLKDPGKDNLTQRVARTEMWPTPDTNNHRDGTKMRVEAKGRHAISLHHAVALWPTPTLNGNYNREGSSERSGNGLAKAVKIYPTPQARNGNGTSNTPTRQGSQDLQTSVGGQLNPDWVEWLMGFPTSWTNIDNKMSPEAKPGLSSHWMTEPDVPRVATGIKSRVGRLKCLGNAVVPQQAYPIFAAIAQVESER